VTATRLAAVVGGLALVGLALPAPVVAQGAKSPGPTVGAWASYRWTSTLSQTVPVLVQQAGPGGRVAVSVVQEPVAPGPLVVTYGVVRADRGSYTLQIVTQAGPDSPPLSVTQVTLDRASGKARRSVIRGPKGPVATPESALRPFREAAVPQGQREEVVVPAGRLTAVHGQAQGAEVWVSDTVPVLGLVKAVWRDGTLELAGSAQSGAKDLLKAGSQ
jgi:hypothetical protein